MLVFDGFYYHLNQKLNNNSKLFLKKPLYSVRASIQSALRIGGPPVAHLVHHLYQFLSYCLIPPEKYNTDPLCRDTFCFIE
jgi:hypothetical protein